MMKVTIKDIATHCGVGKATVSRAINSSGYVKPEVRDRILAYVDSIDWQPSATASALTTGKTYTIGIMVNSISYYINHILLEILNQKFIDAGYQTILSIRHTVDELAKYKNRQVDAMVIFAPRPEMKAEILKLQQAGIRVVSLGYGNKNFSPFVKSDKLEVGERSMTICAESGNKNVLFLGTPCDYSNIDSVEQIETAADRELLAGVTEAADSAGVDFSLPHNCLGAPSEKALLEALRSGSFNSCISFTVPNTIKLYSCCQKLNIRIPEELSIVAIEADEFYQALNPVPTHFINDYQGLCNAVVEMLFSNECPADTHSIIPYKYVQGKSIAGICD